jgi:threonylcarbamoyladenosine tRNA methylthiotransferase MtaB
MVGFPGESEAEFEAGLRFVEAMGFSRLHVFRYSLRAGTLAALMGNPVSEPIKHARSQAMIAIGRESSRKFRQRFISRRLEVLWESRDDKPAPTLGRRALLGAGSSDSDGWSGYTDNYIRVTTGRSGDWHNVIALTELESLRGDGMWGRIIDDGGQG